MKIGICAEYEKINLVKEIGFDYLEGSVSRAATMNKEEFAQLEEKVKQSGIECEVCNLFFPPILKVTGPDVDIKKIDEYLKIAFERLSMLGTKCVVVGSGNSRRVPEGWSKDEGIKQFAEVMKMIGDEGEKYGIVATVEHLPSSSCNIINSVKESWELLKVINHPNVKMMVDYGHMKTMKESLDSIVEAGNEIIHLHIRNSKNGKFPLKVDEDNYQELFNKLKQIGYKGRISIEASTSNFSEDAAVSLKVLRQLVSSIKE
ncbi:MAG TPA: sugar phosphate isomerase/epimerase [Clostridiaceae bacterium]|nr:sugar phosphate isomerase/epimerase [Clostridiaceae bacterium]